MHPPRILIADDDPGIRDLFRAWLRSEPWEVEIVADGRQALDAIGRSVFDIAILDLYMPNLSGLEVFQGIQAKGLDTHIVIMTGYTTTEGTLEKAVEAMKGGAFDFLTKPLKMDDLLTTIRGLIERRHPSPHALSRRLDAFLETHSSDPNLSIDVLCKTYRISSRYVSKLFREQIGAPFRRRLSLIRVQKAKRLLESTDEPLDAIAIECGFRNYHRLSEAFSRLEGMPPGRYRKISAYGKGGA